MNERTRAARAAKEEAMARLEDLMTAQEMREAHEAAGEVAVGLMRLREALGDRPRRWALAARTSPGARRALSELDLWADAVGSLMDRLAEARLRRGCRPEAPLSTAGLIGGAPPTIPYGAPCAVCGVRARRNSADTRRVIQHGAGCPLMVVGPPGTGPGEEA